MRARLLAGYLLLFLVVPSLTGTALDRASFHSSVRQQWRASTQHQGASRLPQRSAHGIPGGSPASPVPGRLARLVSGPHPDPASLVPASIFVPPRV